MKSRVKPSKTYCNKVPTFTSTPSEGETRIKLASIFGIICTIGSVAGLAWLTNLLPFYTNNIVQNSPVTIWMKSDVPLSFHYSYFIDYGNPETKQNPKVGTLVSISIINRKDPNNRNSLSQNNTKFEFRTKYKIISFKIDTTKGDVTDRSIIKANDKAIGGTEYILSPEPETFTGSLWLYIDDIATKASFSERKISVRGSMFNLQEYGKLNPDLSNEFKMSVILPQGHEAVSYAPFSFRKTDNGFYVSDPDEAPGNHVWGQALRMTFKNQHHAQLEQGMIIAFSTIFGVGISLIIEAFLAGGVILLHKKTIAEIRQEAKAITGGSSQEQQKVSKSDNIEEEPLVPDGSRPKANVSSSVAEHEVNNNTE